MKELALYLATFLVIITTTESINQKAHAVFGGLVDEPAAKRSITKRNIYFQDPKTNQLVSLPLALQIIGHINVQKSENAETGKSGTHFVINDAQITKVSGISSQGGQINEAGNVQGLISSQRSNGFVGQPQFGNGNGDLSTQGGLTIHEANLAGNGGVSFGNGGVSFGTVDSRTQTNYQHHGGALIQGANEDINQYGVLSDHYRNHQEIANIIVSDPVLDNEVRDAALAGGTSSNTQLNSLTVEQSQIGNGALVQSQAQYGAFSKYAVDPPTTLQVNGQINVGQSDNVDTRNVASNVGLSDFQVSQLNGDQIYGVTSAQRNDVSTGESTSISHGSGPIEQVHFGHDGADFAATGVSSGQVDLNGRINIIQEKTGEASTEGSTSVNQESVSTEQLQFRNGVTISATGSNNGDVKLIQNKSGASLAKPSLDYLPPRTTDRASKRLKLSLLKF